MNADLLLKHYEHISDAQDAVDRLRKFVLDLAIRGKVVDQDPSEEPASALLKEIAEEKANLIKTKAIRKPKAHQPLSQTDIPYPVPAGWVWSQIAEIGILNPRNDVRDDLLSSFVPMQLIAADYGVQNGHEPREWGKIKKGYTNFAEGDVGLAKITPCFENGKSTVFRNLTGGLGAGTTELHVVRPIRVLADYIVLFLKSPQFIETGIPKMTGTAGQKRVPSEYFSTSPFPLPPLAEQHRIVAKVEELMALCDQLEEARNSREATRDMLTAASLARLTDVKSTTEKFRESTRFAISVLPSITHRPDQIKKIRQTILDLAVRGKLVEQNPDDEPTSKLLERIALGSARHGKKHAVSPLQDDEIPFDLPSGWAWSRIGEICSKTGSGSTPRGGKDAYKSSGVYFLRSQNVHNNGLRLDDVAFIDEQTHERMKGTHVKPRDLLLNITGGSMGRCGLVPEDILDANVSQHVAIIRPADDGMAEFLHALVLSPYFQAFIFGEQTGAGRGGLPKNRMDKIVVALPPLAEQKRIVAKVEELMGICDQLEASLSVAETTRARLQEATLREALEPAQNALEAAE